MHEADIGEQSVVIERAGLDTLIEVLRAEGYRVVGPQAVDGAIVYETLESGDALPAGWLDEQEPGRYRLVRGPDQSVFSHTVGPQGWKRILFPPRQKLWQGERQGSQFSIEPAPIEAPPTALLGVRACELAAIAIQDRVFLEGPFVDAGYAARRAALFIIAVNCGRSTGTCFCVSMKTGPKARAGYDLALTELCTHDRHEFVVEIGSKRGAALLARVAQRQAEPADLVAADAAVEKAATSQVREMHPDAEHVLKANLEHPRWADVAKRCLACTNCTLVCPTCFCSTVEDVTDLTGDHIGRERRWDSCFTLEFSYIHGGSVRRDGASRYRQWLTHKLAHWHDQFDSSGCVGCGRCISWCPVGIDITEEVAAIAAGAAAPAGSGSGEKT
ncbi:MAG: 4Fe-4S dicluster domain-containing protein [Candidatus Velthaea sp.]|jgi:formate hydrogenlyase subunit 6/NADH:ubiquinone oxidoreductase subunit I